MTQRSKLHNYEQNFSVPRETPQTFEHQILDGNSQEGTFCYAFWPDKTMMKNNLQEKVKIKKYF